MKNMLSIVVAALALVGAGFAQAQEFPVQGSNAAGRPGDQVVVELNYDYGAGFEAIADGFSFEYPNQALSFVRAASTVTASGVQKSWSDYEAALGAFGHGGLFTPNDQPDAPGGVGFYAYSFFTDGSAGHLRIGDVKVSLVFAIKPAAVPGSYGITFPESNVLADIDENEYGYPAALQNLQVTVQALAVPEPAMALMLLPGLAVVGLQVRRRRALRA